MTLFTLSREVLLNRPLEVIFPFFAEPKNLQAITPDWLHFSILTPQPIQMQVGTSIDYKLRVRGIPLRWRSEITVWQPPHRFVDEQRRGPYRQWIHEHVFEARGDRTLCEDRVKYAVFGGSLINQLFVRRDVEMIFDFRERRLHEFFG